jgi:hypothetical protein
MSFIHEILKYKSLSITGLEKNTGKTECLNYIIEKLADSGKRIAITSIGLDGESIDQVTQTHKPEIKLYEGMIFVTNEKHFRQAKIDAEILDISTQRTAMGRLVIAEAKSGGVAIISGPSNSKWLKEIIDKMPAYGVNTTLIDGAISRQSSASPAIAEAMILTTGAALSSRIDELVSKTIYAVTLICLPEFISPLSEKLLALEDGIYTIDEKGLIHDSGIKSIFLLNKQKLFLEKGNVIYISGAITDRLLDLLRMQKNIQDIIVLTRDFTKIFASKMAFNSFIAKGGKIKLLLKSRLLAVCVNPLSPLGYTMDSDLLCERLHQKLDIPVYDIMQIA